jgi:chemotaxis family two-component system response regulator Rcp1
MVPEHVKPMHILLVEDNPGDVRLTQEALKENKILVNLDVVNDGLEAMAFLKRKAPYTEAACPDLILLDLNMPRKDGRAVLTEIKNDPVLRRIPVVILTTSSAESDILKTYDLHANAYVTKPLDLEQFSNITKSIEEFWLTITKLPSRCQI